MKKQTVWMGTALLGAAVMALPAMAEETEEQTLLHVAEAAQEDEAQEDEAQKLHGLAMDYGFSISTPDMEYAATYQMQEDAQGKACLSMELDVAAEEEEMQIPLEEFVYTDQENLYLNVKEIEELAQELYGSSDLADILEAIGVTDDYLSLPLPDVQALGLGCNWVQTGSVEDQAQDETQDEAQEEVQNETQAQDQENALTETFDKVSSQLLELILPFLPQEEDGVTSFTVDDDMLVEAAGQLDTIYRDLMEGLDLSDLQESISSQSFDIKPAISAYIDAVAEGYVMAYPDTSKEEAVEMINEAVDDFMEEALWNMSVTVNGTEVGAEDVGTFSLQDLLEQALGQTAFKLQTDLSQDGMVLTLDLNGQTLQLTGRMEEDGSIRLEFGDGEDVYYGGALQLTQDGAVLTVTDETEQEVILQARLQIDENGYALTAVGAENAPLFTIASDSSENGAMIAFSNDATEEIVSAGYEITEEDGFAASVSYGEESGIYFNANGEMTEESGDGYALVTVYAGDENTAELYGYLSYTQDDTILVEIPAAGDGMEAVKNIAALYFMGTAQTGNTQTPSEG